MPEKMWVYVVLTVPVNSFLYERNIVMSHQNKKSLVKQVQDIYDSKLAIGESKHYDKINGNADDKIYSWSTYNAYMKHANYFIAYCKEKYNCKTIEQCRIYVDEWLQLRIDEQLSSFTIKLEAAALAKLYSCSSTEFIITPERKREKIVRSRGPKIRDKHFSIKNNQQLIAFCKSTGLRNRELRLLTGDKLCNIDEKYYVIVDKGAKGGKYREVPVIGDIDNVITLMTQAGNDKVFKKIPKAADIHGYRADYAKALYDSLARPIEEIPYDAIHFGTGNLYQTEVYNCRKDRKGIKLDKRAMIEVSKALGHNRIDVIAGHYLY